MQQQRHSRNHRSRSRSVAPELRNALSLPRLLKRRSTSSRTPQLPAPAITAAPLDYGQHMHRGAPFWRPTEMLCKTRNAANATARTSNLATLVDEYPAAIASPSYAHQQQQQRGNVYGAPASYAPYQQQGSYPTYPHHTGLTVVTARHPTASSMTSATSSSPGTSASQYHFLSAPPPGYQNRTPPLPTYSKPLAHQPHAVGDMRVEGEVSRL